MVLNSDAAFQVGRYSSYVRAFISIQDQPIQTQLLLSVPVETGQACLYRCGLYRFKCAYYVVELRSIDMKGGLEMYDLYDLSR